MMFFIVEKVVGEGITLAGCEEALRSQQALGYASGERIIVSILRRSDHQ